VSASASAPVFSVVQELGDILGNQCSYTLGVDLDGTQTLKCVRACMRACVRVRANLLHLLTTSFQPTALTTRPLRSFVC
jgi:hypothetical protein